MKYLYILGCVGFTVLGQLIAKWRMDRMDAQIPENFKEKIIYFLTTLLWDPYIIASLSSAFIAAFLWLMVIGKLELSHAYPFMSLAFILVFIFSALLFQEIFTINKAIGTSLIVLGLFFIAR